MKKFLALFLCFLPGTSLATPILDTSTEYVSNYYRSGVYGWRSSYDISFHNQDLIIDIDIDLVGNNPGDLLKNIWKGGIESIWSNAFEIFDGKYLYDTVFNVDWVDLDADHVVTVHNGTGRTNMLNWYMDRPAGWDNSYHDEIAAHEFGHMFGLYDEYYGGAINPVTGLIRPDSIMGQRLADPQADHYGDLIGWLSASTSEPLSLVPDSGVHYYSVPEPSSIAMMALGLTVLRLNRRRITRSD